MRLRIESFTFVLLMVILSSSVVSGQTQGMAIIANNPKAVGIGPFALGHVAFAYQNPSDGLFIFGSMEPTTTSPIAPSDTTSLNTKKEYTFDELKTFLANNGYTSYKAFYVDTPHVDAATAAENGLNTKIYNVAASAKPPINNENCLTAAINVLSAYGASLPDTNLFTITPNAYYLTTPGKMYYPDFMGDDPVIPTSYQKPTEEAAIAGESGNQVGAVPNQPTPVTLTLYFHNGDLNGPVISGAQVTGQDASGNRFQETTDSNGYVTITGDPGNWSFSASADGYTTNPWDQEITETCIKHAFLQMAEAQDDEKNPSTSAKSGSLSIKERIAVVKARLANQERQNFTSQVNPSEVTLTLYVREARDSSSDSNLLIKGAEVKCKDGLGTDSEHTTDSNGRVIITGVSGRWHLRAIAFGHIPVDDVLGVVEDDQTYTIRLSKVQRQDSKDSSKISTETKSFTEGSKNSIVGKWMFYFDWKCAGNAEDPITINFKADGTLIYDDGDTGNWEQYGDTIRWHHNPEYESSGSSSKCWPTCEGTIKTNAMGGTMVCKNPPQIGHDATGCWKAVRVG